MVVGRGVVVCVGPAIGIGVVVPVIAAGVVVAPAVVVCIGRGVVVAPGTGVVVPAIAAVVLVLGASVVVVNTCEKQNIMRNGANVLHCLRSFCQAEYEPCVGHKLDLSSFVKLNKNHILRLDLSRFTLL